MEIEPSEGVVKMKGCCEEASLEIKFISSEEKITTEVLCLHEHRARPQQNTVAACGISTHQEASPQTAHTGISIPDSQPPECQAISIKNDLQTAEAGSRNISQIEKVLGGKPSS